MHEQQTLLRSTSFLAFLIAAAMHAVPGVSPAQETGTQAAAGGGAAPGERVLFEDRFTTAPGAGWNWLREQPQDWCIREGGLEIRVQPGGANSVKNALLRTAPNRAEGKFAIEVTVTNHTAPSQQYEQAGITWYHGGKPVFKLVKERVNGKLLIIPGGKPMPSETVQLRLVVTVDSWTAQYRAGGKGAFQTAATFA